MCIFWFGSTREGIQPSHTKIIIWIKLVCHRKEQLDGKDFRSKPLLPTTMLCNHNEQTKLACAKLASRMPCSVCAAPQCLLETHQLVEGWWFLNISLSDNATWSIFLKFFLLLLIALLRTLSCADAISVEPYSEPWGSSTLLGIILTQKHQNVGTKPYFSWLRLGFLLCLNCL